MTQFIIFELLSVLFLYSATIPKSSRNITVFRIREDHLLMTYFYVSMFKYCVF